MTPGKRNIDRKKPGPRCKAFLPISNYEGVSIWLIIESQKYNPTTGIPPFLKLAAQYMLGGSVDLQRVRNHATEIMKYCYLNAIFRLGRLCSNNWWDRCQSNWCCVSAKAFRE